VAGSCGHGNELSGHHENQISFRIWGSHSCDLASFILLSGVREVTKGHDFVGHPCGKSQQGIWEDNIKTGIGLIWLRPWVSARLFVNMVMDLGFPQKGYMWNSERLSGSQGGLYCIKSVSLCGRVGNHRKSDMFVSMATGTHVTTPVSATR
jgi:hypothetical protein